MAGSRLSRRALALRVGILGVVVGALGGIASARAGSGACAVPGAPGLTDPACAELVRTMAGRVGALSALAPLPP